MVSVNQLALWYASPLPRLGEQPLREVEPLRKLADLRLEPEHAIFEVRHSTLRRFRCESGIGDLPPRHAPPLAVTEVTRRDHDDVEVPDPHPAEREAHPDTALNPPGVEAVQPEQATHERQPERHAARALRHRLVARQGAGAHAADSDRPASASSRCRGITPVWRPTSWPCRNTNSVGMARMPKRCVVAGLRSVSSFTTSTSPWRSRAKSSSTGAIILQGPHQSA